MITSNLERKLLRYIYQKYTKTLDQTYEENYFDLYIRNIQKL